MLKHIKPLVPAHQIYVEPFFGGGALFFAKTPSYLEVINDTNDLIINFFEVCSNLQTFNELQQRIEISLLSETLHSRSWFMLRNPEHFSKVDLAWALWVASRQSFASKLGGGWRFDNGTDGSHGGVMVENARRKFTSEIYERLKHTQISCRDALQVIENRNTDNTFLYLDPPYPGSDQGHYKGYTSQHLGMLLTAMETFKGKFMLSNFNHPLISEFVKRNGWIMNSYDMPLTVSNKAYSNRKTEILVRNYEIQNLFSQ